MWRGLVSHEQHDLTACTITTAMLFDISGTTKSSSYVAGGVLYDVVYT
jgi:hypothetical protein